jgi:hypothetical protein
LSQTVTFPVDGAMYLITTRTMPSAHAAKAAISHKVDLAEVPLAG